MIAAMKKCVSPFTLAAPLAVSCAVLVAGCASAQDAADPAGAEPGALETAAPGLSCVGAAVQGGLLACQTEPGAVIENAGTPIARADAAGWASLGVARDATGALTLRARTHDGLSQTVSLAIEARAFQEGSVPGLDCDFVRPPRDEAIQARIAREWARKQEVFNAFAEGDGARTGFILPGPGAETSPYGSRRTKTGVSATTGESCARTSTHWGLDLRAPVGSPVNAPADGVVVLAEPLYFEGGAVFIDHGQGLVSVFMHMETIDVSPGDVVRAGDLLGGAGMTGSANGPHIHWGLKWRNTQAADRSGDFYVDPRVALSAFAKRSDSAAAASDGDDAL